MNPFRINHSIRYAAFLSACLLLACQPDAPRSRINSLPSLQLGSLSRNLLSQGNADRLTSAQYPLTRSQLEFMTQSIQGTSITTKEFLPNENRIVHELQEFIDIFDSALRTEILQSGTPLKSPRPMLTINKKADAHGARVLDASLCFNVRVGFTNSVFDQNSTRRSISGNNYSRVLEDGFFDNSFSSNFEGATSYRCISPDLNNSDTREWLKLWLKDVYRCEATVEASQVILADQCAPDLAASRYAAGQLNITVNSNWIEFDLGYITGSDEIGVIATLMHELAHFYLAHSIANRSNYEIFYDLEALVASSRPSESIAKKLIADRIRQARDRYFTNQIDETLKSKYVEAVKAGDQARLGFYSVEEEADNIGLEWLAKIGIDPNKRIVTMMDSFEKFGYDNSFVPLLEEASAQVCRVMFQNNFRDADGKPIIVTIGDYHEPHHSVCFRATNFLRQIELYQYRTESTLLFEFMPPGEWAIEVQKISI